MSRVIDVLIVGISANIAAEEERMYGALLVLIVMVVGYNSTTYGLIGTLGKIFRGLAKFLFMW